MGRDSRICEVRTKFWFFNEDEKKKGDFGWVGIALAEEMKNNMIRKEETLHYCIILLCF
jgi:hypothetical protein